MDEDLNELFARFEVGVPMSGHDSTDSLIALRERIHLERYAAPKVAGLVFHPQDPYYLWLKSQIDKASQTP